MKSLEDIVKPYEQKLKNINYKNIKNLVEPNYNLFSKWAYRVERGWYGFDVGGMPDVWLNVISDFLGELERDAPDFKIHQIKLKFGGLRFYVNLNLKDNQKLLDLNKEISKLENFLYNEQLVY